MTNWQLFWHYLGHCIPIIILLCGIYAITDTEDTNDRLWIFSLAFIELGLFTAAIIFIFL